jgi:hypothetical protein
METRVAAIRRRLDSSGPVDVVGPEALVAWLHQQQDDLRFLLEECERLAERVRMYEVVKS